MEYQKKVEENIAEMGDRDKDEVEGTWGFFKESIMKTAEIVCGKKMKRGVGRVGYVWWTEKVKSVKNNTGI